MIHPTDRLLVFAFLSIATLLLLSLEGMCQPGEPLQSSPKQGMDNQAKSPYYISNFLNDKGYSTSHVLMSDYLNNKTTPDRAASDPYRTQLIERARKQGYNRFHIYGTNDDNYSSRRGGDFWVGVPDRALFYDPKDEDHWYHWFVQVREAGMRITLWLWPNDATQSYNNEKMWPDDKVIEQMRKLIDFGCRNWKGEILVDEFVLKLEAEDEWIVERINRIAPVLKEYIDTKGLGQTLWYHNQTTDLRVLSTVDWKSFTGIRYQYGPKRAREDMQKETLAVLAALPGHVLFYGSEYGISGDDEPEKGDYIMELTSTHKRIVGVDNGATVKRWIK